MSHAGGRGLIVSIAICLATAGTSEAQGRGRAFGRTRNAPRPVPGATVRDSSGQTRAGPGLGVWLDNADVLSRGEAWLSLYMVYWQSDVLSEVDAPVADFAVGALPRTQIGLSIPYYVVRDESGDTARGVGDVYLQTKIAVIVPQANGFALSVGPTLSISPGVSVDDERVSWVLPVSAQVDQGNIRVYGSAGYFSRGSFFTAGAVDVRVAPRMGIVGSVSRATEAGGLAARPANEPRRTRTDVSGGAYVQPRSPVVFFGVLGRSFGSDEAMRGTYLSAGVTFAVSGAAVRPVP